MSNEGLSLIERINLRADGNKLLHDTMKQLVTISSGSILIMIAFLQKIFPNPQWKSSVAIAFVSFLLCDIASLVMMRTISLKMGAAYAGSAVEKFQKIENWAFPLAAGNFMIATAALVVFVIRNLQSLP